MLRKMVLVLVLGLVLLGGCLGRESASPPTPTPTSSVQNVKLFYGDAGNEKIVFEERKITIDPCADKYRVVLEELLKGPQTQGYRTNIAAGTRTYGTIRQGERLIIDFSRQFNQFAGSIAEIIGVGSVVNTMTQFSEIKEVKILVEGEEYIGPSGEPRGFMKAFTNP